MTPYVLDELPLQSLDWTKFISLIGSANAGLARYDATLQAIVNPHVLLSPLTTQEAVLSSKIEGVRGQELGRGELRKVQNGIGSPGSTMKTRVPEAIATQFTVQTIDALFDRPIFRTTDFVTRTGISKRTAMRILAALEESKVLTAVSPASGRRAAILAFGELIRVAEGRNDVV
jgi:hypothetical protein